MFEDLENLLEEYVNNYDLNYFDFYNVDKEMFESRIIYFHPKYEFDIPKIGFKKDLFDKYKKLGKKYCLPFVNIVEINDLGKYYILHSFTPFKYLNEICETEKLLNNIDNTLFKKDYKFNSRKLPTKKDFKIINLNEEGVEKFVYVPSEILSSTYKKVIMNNCDEFKSKLKGDLDNFKKIDNTHYQLLKYKSGCDSLCIIKEMINFKKLKKSKNSKSIKPNFEKLSLKKSLNKIPYKKIEKVNNDTDEKIMKKNTKKEINERKLISEKGSIDYAIYLLNFFDKEDKGDLSLNCIGKKGHHAPSVAYNVIKGVSKYTDIKLNYTKNKEYNKGVISINTNDNTVGSLIEDLKKSKKDIEKKLKKV